MQLHQLQSDKTLKKRKRIGRGGKRGTYSGKGLKGQKSRAGKGMRLSFKGGDTPIFKLFPKKRGATKKIGIRKIGFLLRKSKPISINLDAINRKFKAGDIVTPDKLLEIELVDKIKNGVKILSNGKLDKKLTFEGFIFSKPAIKKINQIGGIIK